jgi:hypothetical protein
VRSAPVAAISRAPDALRSAAMSARALASILSVWLVACGATSPPERHEQTATTSGEQTSEPVEPAAESTPETGEPDPEPVSSGDPASDASVAPADSPSAPIAPSAEEAACRLPCTAGDVCENAAGWRCDCAAQHDVNCGGAARAQMPPTWAWQCAPRDPATDRGDGCPHGLPPVRSGCIVERTCRYPSDPCGLQGVDAVCASGTWSHRHFMMDPPA